MELLGHTVVLSLICKGTATPFFHSVCANLHSHQPFFKIASADLRPLFPHINIRTGLSMSPQKPAGISTGVVLRLEINLGTMVIFTLLSLLTQEHCTPHLFKSVFL